MVSEALASGELDVHAILKKFNVERLCATDDPIDSLEWYQIIESDLDVVVTPAWRPDRAMYVRDAGVFIQYLTKFPN